jgi:hypothetical protein
MFLGAAGFDRNRKRSRGNQADSYDFFTHSSNSHFFLLSITAL